MTRTPTASTPRAHRLLLPLLLCLAAGAGAQTAAEPGSGAGATPPASPKATLAQTLSERNAMLEQRIAELEGAAATDAEEPARDPFTPLPAFNTRPTGPGTAFIANPTLMRAPELELKGIVNREDEVTALLRIGPSRVYMVRAGDQISFDPTRPSEAIKIREISRLSVIVEIGSIGNVVVVR